MTRRGRAHPPGELNVRTFNYLRTWSAVKRYQAALGRDPVSGLRVALSGACPDSDRPRTVRMPLFIRAGRNRQGA